MSIKEKLIAKKNKVVTFISENKQGLINAVTLGALAGAVVILTDHERRINRHTKAGNDHIAVTNKNADIANWKDKHPWYLEKLDDGMIDAKRISLDPTDWTSTEEK